MHVVVIGAGIGGLAAALALTRAGLSCEVHEQASALGEIGAGLQITPNATRVLHALGLADELASFGAVPVSADSRRWDDWSMIGSRPLADAMVREFGARWYTVHRADLHRALAAALPAGVVRLGSRLTSLDDAGTQVQLGFSSGDTVRADVVVGADGIHSRVRRELFGEARPRFTGNTAFRGLVPADAAAAAGVDLGGTTTAVLGPGRHFVCYPVAAGRLLNWVAMAPSSTWTSESWTEPAAVADALVAYDGWAPVVRTLISMADHGGRAVYRWGLHDRDPLPEWGRGRVTLLGDAAHPMLPFLAQGAAQAIEDAAVLARCLVRVAHPADALRTYEGLRRERTAAVQLGSRRNSIVFHLDDGPEQRLRDERLRSTADPALAHPNTWIYDYDVGAATTHL